MTTLSTNQTLAERSLVRRVLDGFGAIDRAFELFFAARTTANEFEHLQSLSDEALARRGLRRDEIVRHVYGKYLAV